MQPVNNQKYTCCICLDDISSHLYEIKQCPTALRCGHVFHLSCVNEWFKGKLNCPLCRERMSVMKISGPITFESIRRLERRERREDTPFMTALRVMYAVIYLGVLAKIIFSKSRPPAKIIKPIS